MRADVLPLSQVRKLPKNPKLHDLTTIHESIDRFGFLERVVLNETTGRMIAGHGRCEDLEARKAAGEDPPAGIEANGKDWLVPVDYVAVDPADESAAAIALNRLTETGGWDTQALADILSELASQDGADPFRGIGYTSADLDAMIAELTPPIIPDAPEPQTDRAEELRELWGVEAGQVFRCGKHRVMCGDSTKAADVEKLLDGKEIKCILTDPPYGQAQVGVTNDEPENLSRLISGFLDCLRGKDLILIAFQSPRTFPVLLDHARNRGFDFDRMLWMYKAAQCTYPWRGWILTSESILIFSRGNVKWNDVKPYAHDCYYLSELSGELNPDSGWHGSVKPIKVVSDILQRVTMSESVVFDPFLGSGTTLVACEQLGRVGYGMEIDAGYVAVSLQRLSDMGLTPEKVQ